MFRGLIKFLTPIVDLGCLLTCSSSRRLQLGSSRGTPFVIHRFYLCTDISLTEQGSPLRGRDASDGLLLISFRQHVFYPKVHSRDTVTHCCPAVAFSPRRCFSMKKARYLFGALSFFMGRNGRQLCSVICLLVLCGFLSPSCRDVSWLCYREHAFFIGLL